MTLALPTRTRTLALVTVSLATFMTYLDNNIVNVAIPAIQRDLALSTVGLEWVVSAYLLTFAGLLLAGGRVGDVLGRRRLFLGGLAVFALASLAAGLAGNVDVLVASRAVQGIGAAMITPTTLALISTLYPDPRERTAAIGIWSAVGALALAVGPLLGGLISQHLPWGWIFFINVPVGALTIALGWWAIPADAGVDRTRRLDVPGILASTVALVALTYALIEGHDKGWTSAPIAGAFALAALAAAVFALIERRAADPMVDVSLFADPVFTGGITAVVMWGFGLFGIYFFTSLYLQGVLGFSPTEAGTAFVPMALLMAIGAVLAERVSARIGAGRSAGIAMLLMAAGIASVGLLGRDATFVDLLPSFALIGIGGGLSVPLTAMIIGTMPAAQAGVASGIFNASREVAGLLGITVIGAILTARQGEALRAGHDPVDAFLSGYRAGLVVAAVLVAAGGLAAWLTCAGAPPSRPPPSCPPRRTPSSPPSDPSTSRAQQARNRASVDSGHMLLASPLSPSTLLSGSSALLVLAIILFAECGLLIGFFLPGDTLLFAAGVSIATGTISTSLTAFLIVTPIAALVGNLVGYAIGYRVGPVVFDRPQSRIFRPEFVERAHRFYERFGSWTVIVARFVPIVRTVVTVMAGVGRMRFWLYLLYSAIGGAIWTDGMLLLGHQLGHVKFVREHKGDIDYLIIGAVLVGLIPVAIHYVQGRRRQRT